MKKAMTLLILILCSIVLFGCDTSKEYVDYMDTFNGYQDTIGSSTNNESFEDMTVLYDDQSATNIKVLPVELKEDYIIGMDISSIIEVEKAGGRFYNDQGLEQDVFEILKTKGVNYVRIRLWNEPYTTTGLGYGGGNNDIETNIKIAKRAARVGMRILLDFHYSDFWADPGKQQIPRAWKDLSEDDLEDAIYQFTFDTIKRFETEGVRPHMVQIGNEINNGFLFPVAPVARGYARISKFLKQGLKAVNDVSEDILTAIHLAEGASEQRITYFFDKMLENNVEFDIIGLSYYSFWHGPMNQFKSTLAALNDRYEQDIVVMEYSYGFTDNVAPNASHIYNSELESAGGYGTSFQGQASYIRDVNEAIASIDKGLGSFYWEPAWLPVAGAGWATAGAASYLELQGDDTSALGMVSWANQALFTFSGKSSPTLNVFNLMKTSTFDEEEIIDYQAELAIVLNIRGSDTLPTHITGYTSLDRLTSISVTWNQEEVDAMDGAGTYVISGSIVSGLQTLPVTITVEAYENYIENSSFEEPGRVTSDVKDFSLVPHWNVTQSISGSIKVESKNPRKADNNGFNNINVYATSAYTFTLYQDILLQPGEYKLTIWSRSNNDNAERPSVNLFASIGDTVLGTSIVLYGAGWSDWTQTTLIFTVTSEATVRVGINGSGQALSWAHYDDFALQKYVS